jgi:hypothetical protein
MRWGAYGRMQQKLEVVVNDRVCEACNNGFSRRLDEKLRKFMGSSITDAASVDLTCDEQRRAARWAYKVGLLLMLWVHDECERQPELIEAARASDEEHHRPFGEPHVPVEDFARFYEKQLPPPYAHIWFGEASEDLPQYFSSVSVLARPGHPAPVRLGYYALFVMKHLVVYLLVGLPDHGSVPEQVGFDPGVLMPDALVPTWPVGEDRRHWPPARELAKADLEHVLKCRIRPVVCRTCCAWQRSADTRAI